MESLEAGIKRRDVLGSLDLCDMRHGSPEVKLLIQTIGATHFGSAVFSECSWKEEKETAYQVCLRICNLQAVRHHAVAVEFPMRIL